MVNCRPAPVFFNMADNLSPISSSPTPSRSLSDMLTDLRPKQARFFRYYLETMNTTHSYMRAYRTKNAVIAGVNGARLLRQYKEIKRAIYEQAGLGEKEITGVLKEAFGANKQQIYKSRVYEFPDHFARMKAVELAHKLSGEGESDDKPENSAGGKMQVVIINDPAKGIFKVTDGVVEEAA